LTTELIRYSINEVDLVSTNSYAEEWVYIVGTYDSTTQKLYINGSLDQSGAISKTINVTTDARIGAKNYIDDPTNFDGNLANVAIWNRALNSDEINSIMWKSYSELDVVQKNGLQAWYALDDITGTTVPDSTGTNNGTAN